jgi:hypothetical protein
MVQQSLENAIDMLDNKPVQPLHFISPDVVTIDTLDNFPNPEW